MADEISYSYQISLANGSLKDSHSSGQITPDQAAARMVTNVQSIPTTAGGTALTGRMFVSGSTMNLVAPFSPVAWFATSINTLLNLEGTAAAGGTPVRGYGHLIYSETD